MLIKAGPDGRSQILLLFLFVVFGLLLNQSLITSYKILHISNKDNWENNFWLLCGGGCTQRGQTSNTIRVFHEYLAFKNI